jgi:hypothetical protein
VTGSRDETVSVGVRLLADLRDIFGEADLLATVTILERLHRIDEAPWADWYGRPLTDRALAKMLKPYGVNSTKIRIGEQSVRGYRRGDLGDAWSRYLTPVGHPSGTSGTVLTRGVPLVPLVPDRGPTGRCTDCGGLLGEADLIAGTGRCGWCDNQRDDGAA